MEASDTRAVITLSGVSHSYRRVRALDGVELTLPAGQLSGLIGPDGVGKSTLLGLVAGVRRLQAGQVLTLGADLSDRSQLDAVRHRIAYMPQGLGRNLYATLSVRENLDFFGRLFGQSASARRARIDELTRATGLADFVDRPAIQLSGGMKQKLGLCCALIQEPDLLILDEPTTGVDPLSRRRFWQFIDSVRARRPEMSILVSTAYMEEAERFDMLAAMDAGRILAVSSADELRRRTGQADMEAVFVALLPEPRRRDHHTLETRRRASVVGSSTAIRATGLSRRFADFLAVDGVDLEIRKGEIFGFLGSNGSGKTTTMRMLTGLLPISAGQAWVFDTPVDHSDASLRRRLGFMSQSFSLYAELSVRRNLDLHARLFDLDDGRRQERIQVLAGRFDLERHLEQRAEQLPLGVRQRLSLAVAMIHEPELLILDEPTSGVDPIARDAFWALLLDLSRRQGVTIFISTHFMNEAERCDRISLMHAGRILAQGTPAELKQAQGSASLDDSFIAYIEQASADPVNPEPAVVASATRQPLRPRGSPVSRFSLQRFWAYAQRETMELRRDPIRLIFALLGPLLLMVAMGYGISFDVERIRYAVLDYDRSPQSRLYLEQFSGSGYFERQPDIIDGADLTRSLTADDYTVAIEIPPGFGRSVRGGLPTEIAVWIDGAIPFRGETILGYVQAVHARFIDELGSTRSTDMTKDPPILIETRFRYNQAFESVYAMVPGIMMLLLIMIPATMTAVGVVREKELGSITNFYATPTRGTEFLLGKQLPYVGLAMLSYAILLLQALFMFRIPMQGSLVALTIGALLFVFATTGLGLLMSSFMRSQIGAVFATAIASTIPTILFSGMLVPVSSLIGPARVMGFGFPSAWFNHISVGTFTKGLGFEALWLDYAVLIAFGMAFFTVTALLLRGQER
jgi:ribosome-dependent ATPase